MAEHATLTDPNLHEVKGASTAVSGTVLTATGSGTATFQALPSFSTVKAGSYRIVNSSATTTALTVAGTYYSLPNDSVGTGTSSTYGVSGVTDLWDEANSQFLWSQLALGDIVDVEIELDVTTTTANTAIDVVIDLGVGDANTYTIPLVVGQNIKAASTTRFAFNRQIVIRDNVTRVNPGRIRAKADTTGATVLVKSFNLIVIKR